MIKSSLRIVNIVDNQILVYYNTRENKGTEREAPGPALGICQLH